MTHHDKPDKHDKHDEATSEGQVSESEANPTPPAADPASTPGVKDTPQTPPDHEEPRGQ
ncbi:hypothetical protein [Nocardioides jishulii]|uniref:hypothetical protein n=1 Tax=Nocardioides jishulii TaxID=2575440 RepID=UPI0014859C89|nr:hypothetical protein [Nocardioides jishulii]